MFRFLLRSLWRLFIFILGIVALTGIVTMLWPESNSRPIAFLVLMFTYCVMAYFIVPLLFRLYHFIIKHDHIPLYATTSDGWASDPVNLAIICKDRADLQRAMTKAGWYEADPPTLANNLREAQSIVFGTAYPKAPVSGLYLFNRRHDIAFQIPTNPRMNARTRHHVRFWRLEEPLPHKHDHNHFEFWSKKLQEWIHPSREVWIGACTEDVSPLGLRYRTGTLTHRIDGDADKERDFIVETLEAKKLVARTHISDPGEQFKFRSQQAHITFITDGSIRLVRLR